MKKLISTLLVAVMLVSLVACGGENLKLAEALEAYNGVATQYNDVAALINDNPGILDEESFASFAEMSDLLVQYNALLTGDSIPDDAKLDEIIAWFGDAKAELASSKSVIEEMIAGGNANAFPAALANVNAYEIPDIELTGWQLAGGILDGVEMEQAELDAVLAATGGVFQVIFLSDGVAQLVNGETALEGTYTADDENVVLTMEFPGYAYYGVFTVMGDDTVVLIIANTEAPTSAFYLVPIDEH